MAHRGGCFISNVNLIEIDIEQLTIRASLDDDMVSETGIDGARKNIGKDGAFLGEHEDTLAGLGNDGIGGRVHDRWSITEIYKMSNHG